ncbi:LarC family nickel insertion protein [Bacillus sp. CECT 9360]|uniref:LarC family nickel insertion protein n=1 Tax=Bacillus sp. CECT 9360 TaxID=2845821 RepID=UPI001E3ACA0B|nr:LarC family nickel insertion protein [Bacillus sp. CECT 9360]CAH0343849.1 Pyridinium-3,5-bisthiocarboxylic acid mononucleotide nickel insertion protein [Bacillus sp. CECT 9360]
MKTLFIDCGISGIAGDMALAAFTEIGADIEVISDKLKPIIKEDFSLSLDRVVKKGISSTKLVIETEEEKHSHRHYSTIKKAIDESFLSESEKATALSIFEVIAIAEAKIHNSTLEKVHFHEVGGVDSMIDIIGTAIAFHQLGIERVISSQVAVGNGYLKMAHGLYPIPAPATLEILKNIPLLQTEIQGELTTPTGAAIIRTLTDEFAVLPSMQVSEIGYGAGTKDFKGHPNVVRFVLGEL